MPVTKVSEGRWRVRLRFGKGLRDRFIILARTEPEAEAKAGRMQRMANELAACGKHVEAKAVLDEAGAAQTEKEMAEIESVVRDLCAEATADAARAEPQLSGRTTFGQVAELLFQRHIEAGNKPRTLQKDRSYMEVLRPRLGKVRVEEITNRVADEAMQLVPASVESSRNLYEGFISRVLKLAVRLELIPSYPLRADFVSDQKPPSKMFQYLRVDEDFALITTRPIPIERRIGYALMSREGVRPEFLTYFFWADRVDPEAKVSTIDLESGLLTHRHKQKRVRRWLVDERVLRVLTAWRALHPDSDRVLPTWDNRNIALVLRKDLLMAGVTRAALHRTTATERQIGAKDAGRATFVTLALRAGAPMHWVTDRTGHATDEMVERYTRMARESRDTVRAWLRPMDEAFGPELGLEATTDRYVVPWLQGIQAPEASSPTPFELGDLGQQLGHVVELLKRSGTFTQQPGTMLYSGPATVESAFKPESAPADASEAPTSSTGPAEIVGMGQAGPVELALAMALEAATRAQRWDVVLEVTRELSERRRARTQPEVTSLEYARKKRDEGGGK